MNLLSDQISAKEKLLSLKVGALFMSAGTGKTRVALDLVNSINNIDLVIYIAPYQIIHRENGVQKEIEKWGGFNCNNIVYVGIESIQASDRIYLELIREIEKSNTPFIIVDESLKIKNVEAKRTKRLIELSKMFQYKLILNGTPISRNILDLFSQMYFLSPKILNMDFAEFKNTFCEYTRIIKRLGRYKEYTKEFITGYENIDYLYSLIRHYVFEADLKLNLKQYYSEIFYKIDEDILEEYYSLKEKYLDNEKLQFLNNNIFLELTQKMQHLYCCCENKFEKVTELFEEISEEKTIIFCKYIKSRDECKKRFPKATILSYQKESLGLNMQHLNNTIYFDKIWDYALRIQSIRRTFRTGQEQDCRYWDMTGNVGLEYLIDKNINKKINITEYLKLITNEKLKEEL